MKLILVRHGESEWNLENRFTGWTDVELTSKGINEAREAGILLKNKNINVDIAYTSLLKRSKDTLKYMLEEMNINNIEIKSSYKLNERHYGALQGLNKKETANKYGDEQVKIWRRSYDVRPPMLEETDSRYPGNDKLYENINISNLPLSESLCDTSVRVIEYYNDEIINELKKHKNVLIVAHGNSLRSLVMYLLNLNKEEVINLEIPTGKPICIDIDEELKVINNYYL